MFKRLDPSDVDKTPFKVYKEFTVTNEDSGSFVYNFRAISGSHRGYDKTTAGVDTYQSASFFHLPAWFMLKRTDSTNDWIMFDNKRDAYQNPFADYVFANLSDAENADTARGDFLSNGVKIRSSANAFNASSGTYIFMAFAEHPFVSSKGVPVTAK